MIKSASLGGLVSKDRRALKDGEGDNVERTTEGGRGVVLDLIKEEGLLSEEKIESIMKPENLTGPSSFISAKKIPDLNREFTHARVASVDEKGGHRSEKRSSKSCSPIFEVPKPHDQA